MSIPAQSPAFGGLIRNLTNTLPEPIDANPFQVTWSWPKPNFGHILS